jgi:hypothetical protein
MKTKEEKKAQIRDCLRRRKIRMKKIGLCQDCGMAPIVKERTLCMDCLEARRRRHQKSPIPQEKTEDVEKMLSLVKKAKSLTCGKHLT